MYSEAVIQACICYFHAGLLDALARLELEVVRDGKEVRVLALENYRAGSIVIPLDVLGNLCTVQACKHPHAVRVIVEDGDPELPVPQPGAADCRGVAAGASYRVGGGALPVKERVPMSAAMAGPDDVIEHTGPSDVFAPSDSEPASEPPAESQVFCEC